MAQKVPPEELERRAGALQARMAAEGLPAMLVLQTSDICWLTGSVQQGLVFVPAEGAPVYCVRKDLARARAESSLARVVAAPSPRDLPAFLKSLGLALPDRLGLELDVVPFALIERWRKALPGVDLADGSGAIRSARAVKSSFEVDRIRAAAMVADAVVRRACELLRPGIPEQHLQADLEREAILLGHQGLVRMRGFNAELHFGQVLSGPSGALSPPGDTPLGGEGPNPCVGHGAGPRLIGRDEPVIVDVAIAVDGYVCDQTRTLCAGRLPDELRVAHDHMVAVMGRVVKVARPGAPWSLPYDEAVALASSLGHTDRFMGAPSARAPFVGHGVGLDLDELPVLARGFKDRTIEAGMTIAVEPKVVFAGVGAVGIEDTFLVTDGGLERLTVTEQRLFEV